MSDELRLMAVMAHPDDESLGVGPLLAKCAAEGVATYLVMATRGQRGWAGDPAENPGLEGLGKLREAELAGAARLLGLREVSYLDYMDGELNRVDPAEAAAKIAGHLRRAQPQVVVTFGPEGAYGHPDHIAISQLTTAAILLAADPASGVPGTAHRVSKFYYFLDTRSTVEAYAEVFEGITCEIDGVLRRPVGYEDWIITTWIDAAAHTATVLEAIRCHETQMSGYQALNKFAPDEMRGMLGTQTLYRVFSLVNGGSQRETDVFEGLRPARTGAKEGS